MNFGINLGEALEAAVEKTGHTIETVPTPAEHIPPRPVDPETLRICAIKIMMEPACGNGEQRLTLDATRSQVIGSICFSEAKQSQAVLLSRYMFARHLRIHELRLNGFKLDASGRIITPGSIVMHVPSHWVCPTCKRSVEQSDVYKLCGTKDGKRLDPQCQLCAGKPFMKRVAHDLRRPDQDDPICDELYAAYRAGSKVETRGMLPRIWASYRVADLPDDGFVVGMNDIEGQLLEERSRERYSCHAEVDGTVMAVEQAGRTPDSGWRVYICTQADAGHVVRAKVGGIIRSVDVVDGTTVIQTQPHGTAKQEDYHSDVVKTSEMETSLHVGDHVSEGDVIAHPVGTWHRHNSDARATIVVGEGTDVVTGQRLSEGFSIRPVKTALALQTPGICALSLETTHDRRDQQTHRTGWLTQATMYGEGTVETQGFKTYVARPKAQNGAQNERHEADNAVRV